jgi:GMP synthase (glutamine-hydrolysing)
MSIRAEIDQILILDCGGQYTYLIKQSLAKFGFYSSIMPADKKVSDLNNDLKFIKGVIISGGSGDVRNPIFTFDENWLNIGLPIFGICYGHQLIAHIKHGKIGSITREFGEQQLYIKSKTLGLRPGAFTVWQSHSQVVTEKPISSRTIGSTRNDLNSFLVYDDDRIYTTQFHPEVSHSVQVSDLLSYFCTNICVITPNKPWTAKDWCRINGAKFKDKYRSKKIVVALSGGVDSMTLAAFIRKNHKKEDLLAIYVDTGFMPKDTRIEVEKFCEQQDINVKIVNAQAEFLKSIRMVSDPRVKAKRIGTKFIRVFERNAKNFGADFLAQGTIWSDVVESGVTKFSSKIKPHHNVGGLPSVMHLELVEPFRELFKDQVRGIASELKLPKALENKKVFPGPGFSIRVDGNVTKSKLRIIRKATEIVDNIISTMPKKDTLWMAFPILVNAVSLGVRGDKRYWNKHIIVIRAVESKNSMTINASEEIYPYLKQISKELVNKVPGVGRVVYDITDKPPATIEWQ